MLAEWLTADTHAMLTARIQAIWSAKGYDVTAIHLVEKSYLKWLHEGGVVDTRDERLKWARQYIKNYRQRSIDGYDHEDS
jgi:hypothetical protein